MATAIATVTDRYRGAEGRTYHSTVHAGADAVNDAIATSRARKFQPLVRATDRVLEYGAGMLYNLAELRCAERVAFDISDAGARHAAKLGIRFTTDAASVGSDYDALICHHVLEHVAEPLALIEAMAERLRLGGRLLLFVPLDSCAQRYDPVDHHQHLFAWTPATLGNLVASAGLEVEDAGIGRFGYERRLASLHEVSPAIYHAAVFAAQTLRPVREVRVIARKH